MPDQSAGSDPILNAHKAQTQKEREASLAQLKQTLAVVQRIAILAISRLGGTMRITDDEWGACNGADMQWRTVRFPGLEPEIHVAVTLVGESVGVGNTKQ